MKTIALILAGGSGTRLWPLSRRNMPKQLLPLFGGRTLLQETCRRLFPLIPAEDQWIVTGKEQYQQVLEQTAILDTPSGSEKNGNIKVLQEPQAKNTAPAIFWGARRCQELYGNDSVLLVLPSDHLVTGEKQFQEVMQKGIDIAEQGCLVTFGINPTHPETGYGYIEMASNRDSEKGSYPVQAFIEKPDIAKAEEYLSCGNYLWNSGMFAFHVGTLLAEGGCLCPEVATPFVYCKTFNLASVANAYKQARALSIDYALMEKTGQAYVIPADFGWSDVGSWQSLFEISPRDEKGNMLEGEQIVIDSRNCLIYGQERLIAAVGMEEVAIIDTPDALMVCPLNQTQRVKEIVEALKERHLEQV